MEGLCFPVFVTVRFGRNEKAKATTGKIIGGDENRLSSRDGKVRVGKMRIEGKSSIKRER